MPALGIKCLLICHERAYFEGHGQKWSPLVPLEGDEQTRSSGNRKIAKLDSSVGYLDGDAMGCL